MAKEEVPYLFSTRILDDALIQAIKEAGLAYAEKDFINVSHDYEIETLKASINNPNSQARIFTSKNSVTSLAHYLGENNIALSPKKTFTVGIKATEMLANLGIATSARANNAISLAQIIARNADVEEVDFFCGDQSLDDLPEYLESKKIKVNRHMVYYTQLVQHEVNASKFNGVIFLSPTAVYSFFKKNSLPKGVPAFCIGSTTGEAVRLRSSNPRILANEPTIESVVAKAIDYLKS